MKVLYDKELMWINLIFIEQENVLQAAILMYFHTISYSSYPISNKLMQDSAARAWRNKGQAVYVA